MASTLKLNTLTGASTAGSIAVTGEGNSTTTNLQQGLAKMWGHVTQESTQSLDDSFNVASITDGGTGKTTFTIANDMANTAYSITSDNTQDCSAIVYVATGTWEQRCMAHDGSLTDAADLCVTIHGDLA